MGSSSRFLTLFLPPPPLTRLTRLRGLHHRARPSSVSYVGPHCPLRRVSVSRPLIPALSLRRLQVHGGHFSATDSASRLRDVTWPEWSALLDSLSAGGYFSERPPDSDDINEFVPDFPEELLNPALTCLAFARDRSKFLGMLSRRYIETVVENTTPFLFKNGEDSARKMKLYLSGVDNVLDKDKANMVDLMRFLLSYVGAVFSSERDNREFIDSSVKSLLSELTKLNIPESNLCGSVQNQSNQATSSFGKNIEMKRGDWICARCSFMNFGRNVKCLKCEEARPKRQLTGGEWECPQCDFYNYGRNTVCLRCDCKRPGYISLNSVDSGPESKLADNEEKAQRWFSKISQLEGGNSDKNSLIKEEDFPEMMPLRKGVNRFVVSTRKTPLDRRLENAQNRINTGNNEMGNENETLDTKISRSIDEILGHSSTASEPDNIGFASGEKSVPDNSPPKSSSSSKQYESSRQSNSEYVPFVPFPADAFSEKPDNSNMESQTGSSPVEETGGILGKSEKSMNQTEVDEKYKEQEEKSESWFKRVSELHNVSDLASEISDEDFPEIMPMRKGENRFVVSRKKDRSLTTPAYKRRVAMEQSRNSNFVPFVPFPPDYFAKKENKEQEQPPKADSVAKATDETSTPMAYENLDDSGSSSQDSMPSSTSNTNSWSGGFSENVNATNQAMGLTEEANNSLKGGIGYLEGERLKNTTNITGSSPQLSEKTNFRNSWTGFSNKEDTEQMTGLTQRTNSSFEGSSGHSEKETTKDTNNLTGKAPELLEGMNIDNKWRGKSLEGSAVKEPDPLDMSEEAKAERWFKRVAQIKDISELSQIPDEDFPSIMPMRKGVNRFVVSKRKTPLERRLASQQYRKNIPTMNSDPFKKENDE